MSWSADDPDWPLHFSRFLGAWQRSSDHQAGAKGAGIAIVHPDTGWTPHPELTSATTYLGSNNPLSVNHMRRERAEGRTAEDRLAALPAIEFPGHGTATASTMSSPWGHPDADAGEAYNGAWDEYVCGAAPEAVVLPQRVTNTVLLASDVGGWDMLPALASAVRAATQITHPDGLWEVGVISISLGTDHRAVRTRNMDRALQQARRAGIVVCAAAGQGPASTLLGPAYPGRSDHTICAAACDADGNMLGNGYYGPQVDVAAPGVGVAAARARRIATYTVEPTEGSSYAAAMLASACAIWQSHFTRSALLGQYGPAFLLDAFKVAVADTCDTRGGTWNTEPAQPGRWRDTTILPWNSDGPPGHGKGALDVDALLDGLPSVNRVMAHAAATGWTG